MMIIVDMDISTLRSPMARHILIADGRPSECFPETQQETMGSTSFTDFCSDLMVHGFGSGQTHSKLVLGTRDNGRKAGDGEVVDRTLSRWRMILFIWAGN